MKTTGNEEIARLMRLNADRIQKGMNTQDKIIIVKQIVEEIKKKTKKRRVY